MIVSNAFMVSSRDIDNIVCKSSLVILHHSAVSLCPMREQTRLKCENLYSRLLATHNLKNLCSAEFFTDADKRLDQLDATLFPGVDPDVEVHSGFRDEHAVTAPVIFNEVKRLMVDKKTKNVTIVRL
jgi:hypothetical protein